jgi:hypothetical protein
MLGMDIVSSLKMLIVSDLLGSYTLPCCVQKTGLKMSYAKHVIYSSMNLVTLHEFPIIVVIVDGLHILLITFVWE